MLVEKYWINNIFNNYAYSQENSGYRRKLNQGKAKGTWRTVVVALVKPTSLRRRKGTRNKHAEVLVLKDLNESCVLFTLSAYVR